MMRGMGSLFAVLLAIGWAWAAEPAEIDKLVQQLGSDKFKEREAATKGLEAIGPPAIEALRKASLSGDADVRRSAEELLTRIETKLEVDNALAPTRVKLTYKDAKLGEAVKDLARRSGYAIELGPQAMDLAEKAITVETAALPFWEALERFNQAAGLMQQTATVAPTAREPRRRQFGMRLMPQMPTGVVLVPAADVRPPVFLSGALRLRLLPGEKAKDGVVAMVLEAALEPRVRWQERVHVASVKAVDAAGQAVEVQAEESKRDDNDIENFMRQAMPMVIIDGQPMFGNGTERLTLKMKPSASQKSLSEIKGTLTAKVQGPPQNVIEVEDVNTVLNQTVKGKQGFEVKVTKLERQDNGEVEMNMEYVGGQQPLGAGFSQVQVLGGNLQNLPMMPNLSPYTLYDADGQPYQARQANTSSRSVNGKGTNVAQLILVPAKKQATPKRLTFVAPRLASVEIPFAFQNVQLSTKD